MKFSFKNYLAENKSLTNDTKFIRDYINSNFTDSIVQIKKSRFGIHYISASKDYGNFFESIHKIKDLLKGLKISVSMATDKETNQISGSLEAYKLVLGNKTAFIKGKRRRGSVEDIPDVITKDLTPNKLGIKTDKDISSSSIIRSAKNAIKSKGYTDEQKKYLFGMIDLTANGSGESVSLEKLGPPPFSKKSLNIISKDMGEILVGIYLVKRLGFDSVNFPSDEAYPIADLFVSGRGLDHQLISVKSGKGSAASFKGVETLLNTINKTDGNLASSPVFADEGASAKEFELLEIIQIILDQPAVDSVIEISIKQKTPFIVELAKLMKLKNLSSINHEEIRRWMMKHKSAEDLEASIMKIKNAIGMKHRSIHKKDLESAIDGTWKTAERLILVSMTNFLTGFLNKKYKREMNSLIGRLQVWQVNVDWNKQYDSLDFIFRRFKNTGFKMKYAGNARQSTNKIGFIKESIGDYSSFKNYLKTVPKKHRKYAKPYWSGDSTYLNDPKITKYLDKYDDPMQFVLNLIGDVGHGLKYMGKKGIEELVKVWNDNKKEKINARLIESVLFKDLSNLPKDKILWGNYD